MEESRLNAKNGNPAAPEQRGGIVAGVKTEGRQQTESGERVAALFRSLTERMKAAGVDSGTACRIVSMVVELSERAERPDYFATHLLRMIVPKELDVRTIGALEEDVRLFGLLLGKYMRDHGLEMLPEKSTRAIIEQLGNDLKPADMRGHFDHKGRVCDSGVYDSRGDTVYSDGGYWTRKPEPDY
jgi:hypothetical protein